MKKKNTKQILSLVLSVALIAAAMMLLAGCGAAEPEPEETTPVTFLDGDKLGQGAHEFTLIVKDAEGTELVADIHTDKETVGEALQELGIIDGDATEYGMYIMTVNGEYHRYEEDGYFWAFYIDGESAMTGVDGTPVVDGAVYTLAAEAAG